MTKLFQLMVIFIGVGFISNVATAEDGAVAAPSEKELEIRKMVRARQYPGGRDEEPLKIQAQVVNPTRKVISTKGIEGAEPADSEEIQHD